MSDSKFYDGCEITENPGQLKVYYDAEFTGLHRNTTPISMAFVAEDGSWFYAEFTDYDKSQVDNWLQDHVIDNLLLNDMEDNHCLKFVTRKSTRNTGDFPLYNIRIKSTKELIGKALNDWLRSLYEYYDKQLQIYTDCYAYDWMIFNDVVCNEGKALNLPQFISYIPVDLSTALQLNGYDPDITREEFAGEDVIKELRAQFTKAGDHCKHNSLWDTYVAQACFNKLINDCF